MIMEDLCLKIFEQRGIKPTAIRMLVLKVMMETEQAVSLLDFENKLDTVDKSTTGTWIFSRQKVL